MDYNSVKAAGSALGTGAVIVMDETTCMVSRAAPDQPFLSRGILRAVHALPRGHRLAAPHAEPDR